MGVTLTGHDALLAKFKKLQDNAGDVERSGVVAACVVLRDASKESVEGSIKQEVGFSVKKRGDRWVGKAGLMKFPRRGQKNGPHGVYLERGTKYITARRRIEQALRANRSQAVSAMQRASRKKVKDIDQ